MDFCLIPKINLPFQSFLVQINVPPGRKNINTGTTVTLPQTLSVTFVDSKEEIKNKMYKRKRLAKTIKESIRMFKL
ncbi:hypothetical protein AHMF7605_19075 [Adhaeribacter arboris]|uniref:Uncharacterized protein n=1 Tax=Adhaeribacter arboris TaxID=2072846 RepID=A0A2T2YIX7_9BACT|nr:hypothetical protein AHMF7605_19075 [Adhaeribacter arboris]